MKQLEEYKELTKRYDELIKSGAAYDECRVISIRMAALELAVKQEQQHAESEYRKGYEAGWIDGYKAGEQATRRCCHAD